MAEFLQFLFSGLTVGAIYAMVALGFTIIYNASDVINFAQGEFVMIGGMATVFLPLRGRAAAARGRRSPLPSPSRSGSLLHALAIEPARGASAVTLIIITIGASIFMRGVAQVAVRQAGPPAAGVLGRAPDPHRRRGDAAAEPVGARRRGRGFLAALRCSSSRTLLGKAMLATAANRARRPARRHQHHARSWRSPSAPRPRSARSPAS